MAFMDLREVPPSADTFAHRGPVHIVRLLPGSKLLAIVTDYSFMRGLVWDIRDLTNIRLLDYNAKLDSHFDLQYTSPSSSTIALIVAWHHK